MNPADSETDPQTNLLHAVSNQGALLGQHDQSLRGIMDTLSSLTAGLARVERQLQVSPAPTPNFPSPPAAPVSMFHPREPFVPAPERYEGQLGGCKSFLFQCSLVFELHP